MKRTHNRPFFARFLAQQELETVAGGCGGQQTPIQTPPSLPKPPIFTTLKAGKCGNDCDSDSDILPGV